MVIAQGVSSRWICELADVLLPAVLFVFLAGVYLVCFPIGIFSLRLIGCCEIVAL
jgi:hypothetical protein